MLKLSSGKFIGEWKSYDSIPPERKTRYALDHSLSKFIDGNVTDDDRKIFDLIQNNLPKGDIDVLEFGSSASLRTFYLLKTITKVKIRNYTVVELPEVCEVINGTYKNVKAISDFPRSESAHLFFVDSALQYYPEQKKLYDYIYNINPVMIVLRRHPVTNKESFITLQQFNNHSIPHWFKNETEIMELFKGYKVLLKNDHCRFHLDECKAIDLVFKKL